MGKFKYEVIKGGAIRIGGAGGPVRFNRGDVWDVIHSDVCGSELRKLNQRGGSTCLLNGTHFARIGVAEGKLRLMAEDEPGYIAHEALIERTGARAGWAEDGGAVDGGAVGR
jgi:hypothetical protein